MRALNNLGCVYEELGKPQKALEYYLRAAKHGVGMGMYSVGEMYLYGKGVPKDLQEAKNWFEKAKAAGKEIPQEIENELQNALRDKKWK